MGEGSGETSGDVSIEEAAVQLGMSPTAVIRLLESGQLPSHLGPDGRRRRILQTDVDAHRDERFALRQQLVQEQRARRWAEPEPSAVDDLPA
ncbi:MAG: helix-turn-helix domain-containing protein [Mycobacteriales bacterium]